VVAFYLELAMFIYIEIHNTEGKDDELVKRQGPYDNWDDVDADCFLIVEDIGCMNYRVQANAYEEDPKLLVFDNY
jgi:hypothetical protein